MAVLKEAFDDISEILSNNNIKSVLILGDQSLNHSPIHYPDFLYQKFLYADYMKQNYPNIKFDVLDIQGNVDLNIDLNIFHHNLTLKYDLIIDCGTSEHVDNQYNYIQNINNWLNVNGIYYSNSIEYLKCFQTNQLQWINHCFYYYDQNYFEFLERCFDWKIEYFHYGYIEDATKPLTFCCMRKLSDEIDNKLLTKIYDNIHILLEESLITNLNMSDMEKAKQSIFELKYSQCMD